MQWRERDGTFPCSDCSGIRRDRDPGDRISISGTDSSGASNHTSSPNRGASSNGAASACSSCRGDPYATTASYSGPDPTTTRTCG
jgi:hypothetical protein